MEEKRSNAETFSRRSGTLISTEFIDVAFIANTFKVLLMKYQDLISEQSESALRFEYEYFDGYSDFPDTKIGVIDKDELDGLIKSINLMLTQVSLVRPENYTEVKFTSRSGFEAGCYYSDYWKFYIKLSQHDSNSNVFLSMADANTLLNVLSGTKEKLITR